MVSNVVVEIIFLKLCLINEICCVFLISSKEDKVNRMVLKMAETQVNAKLSDNTSKFTIKPLGYILEVYLLNKVLICLIDITLAVNTFERPSEVQFNLADLLYTLISF